MKVLIQNIRTGLYLARHNSWTAAATHAQDFGSNCYAYAVLKTERNPGLRVACYFEELDYMIHPRRRHSERFSETAPTEAVAI
jgi:hypothetical protein